MQFRRLFAVARKELLQLRRDRMTVGMMTGLPVMQLMLFGYAINTDVRHIPTVIYDLDRTTESRALWEGMHASGFYDLVGEVQNYDEISRALRNGFARTALVIPPNYGKDFSAGHPAHAQLVVDGSDPQTVASAINTALSLATSRSSEMAVSELIAKGGDTRMSQIALEPTTWYNPDQKTAIYIVPGLVGVILTMTMVMLTSMAIARERERGTLEQLIVSPLHNIELIIGKIVPYIAIGYVQMSLILLFGHVLFGVPFNGSLALLYTLAFVFISANLGVGIFFSTLAKTQQQAMQMTFFFLLPNILLSGFMFPWEGMPRPAQMLSQCLPLTHFMRIVRGIALKGSNFQDLQIEVTWLAGILCVLVFLASVRFTKKLG